MINDAMSAREAIVRHVQELTIVGKAGSNHRTTRIHHTTGVPAAAASMELILMALGGCTGSDVILIVKKKRVHLSNLKSELPADVRRTIPKYRRKSTSMTDLQGAILSKKAVAYAIDLSMTKYCSVCAMMKKSVAMTYSYLIVDANEREGKPTQED
jgi:putative redox protein